MATKLPPQPLVSKSTGFGPEPNIQASIDEIYRSFAPRRVKMSKNSPPVLNVDVTEGEFVFDKTLLRLYTVADGTLRYTAFT